MAALEDGCGDEARPRLSFAFCARPVWDAWDGLGSLRPNVLSHFIVLIFEQRRTVWSGEKKQDLRVACFCGERRCKDDDYRLNSISCDLGDLQTLSDLKKTTQ